MATQPPDKSTEKKSGGCWRSIALPLAVLLVIVLPLAVLAFDVGQVLFNPPLVKRVLTDEVTKSDLIAKALQWFSDRRAQERVDKGEARTGIDEPDIVLLMSYMDGRDQEKPDYLADQPEGDKWNDWRKIKAEILPDEILTEWVSVTVDGFYAWIDSTDRVPQVTWSLKSFKDRVSTEHGRNSIVIAYSNLPPCTPEQVADLEARLAAAPAGTEVLYNLCEFSDPWHEDQFNDYLNSLEKVVKNIPDEFNLTKEATLLVDRAGVGPEAIKLQLRLIRLLMQLAWIAPLAVLALLLLLAVRSVKDLSRWWGLPLLVGGVFTLLPALAYGSVITSLWSSGFLSEVPDLLRQEALHIVLRLAAEIFQPMLIQAVVVMALGVGVWVWHWVSARRQKRPAPPAA